MPMQWLKTLIKRIRCDHHWHWPEEHFSLCGDVVCCKCGARDDLGAHISLNGGEAFPDEKDKTKCPEL